MIVLEFKDGPNKGKQIVLPTPDGKKPEIDLIGPDDKTDHTEYMEYLRNKMIETSRIPADRFGTSSDYTSKGSESIWKRFMKRLRGH